VTGLDIPFEGYLPFIFVIRFSSSLLTDLWFLFLFPRPLPLYFTLYLTPLFFRTIPRYYFTELLEWMDANILHR